MEKSKLTYIDGKKIRRQYFNIPLIILYSLMLAIPYFIFVISLGTGKLDAYEWPSTLWTSIWICFCFSLPLLMLRALNKHLFGRILCVLTKEGIHHPKGLLRWETIEKIEYAIDSKPRYKSDRATAFRAIIYTQGGKHVVFAHAPLHFVSYIKKRRQDLDVRISGATSLLPAILIVMVIVVLCPFYVLLLVNSPGASGGAHFLVLLAFWLAFGIIRICVFDAYAIRYRFWRRILPKKWLSYLILGCYYSSYFTVLLLLSYFPHWITDCLLGIYLGLVQPPIPSRRSGGAHPKRCLSYEQLCEIYIKKADVWEKRIEQRKQRKSNKEKRNTIK